MTGTPGVAEPDRPPDWLNGAPAIVYQQCGTCDHNWYLPRRTCECCGAANPVARVAGGQGVVHAVTLVSRVPTPEFREIAPYLLIFVDASEGFRMMAHGAPGLRIGDAVAATFVARAGRLLPVFEAVGQRDSELCEQQRPLGRHVSDRGVDASAPNGFEQATLRKGS